MSEGEDFHSHSGLGYTAHFKIAEQPGGIGTISAMAFDWKTAMRYLLAIVSVVKYLLIFPGGLLGVPEALAIRIALT